MSVTLMSQVWRMEGLPATDKMVLLALADAANDDGVCWPAVSSAGDSKLPLCKKCSLSDRAVQMALRRLEAAGLVQRRERPGKSTVYLVCTAGAQVEPDPRTRFTPERGSPPNEVHQTPERGSDDPSENHQYPQKDKPSEGERASAGSRKAGRKAAGQTALPADWAPPLPETLPPSVRGVVQGWPAGAYEFVADMFRAHWRSAGGRKIDWAACWVKWLANEAPKMNTLIRQGQQFVEAGGSRGGGVPANIGVDGCGDARAKKLAIRTSGAMAEATWASWVAPLRFAIEIGELVVRGDAMRVDWCRRHFLEHFEAAARGLVLRWVADGKGEAGG